MATIETSPLSSTNRSVPMASKSHSCCEWLTRIWNRLCEILSSLCCCKCTPTPLTQKQIVPLKGAVQVERLITAYSTHLRQLSPEAAATEFHSVGSALFFSLSPYHKNALIQELSKDGLAGPYGQEVTSLDKSQSPAQEYMQSCLYTLLVLEKDAMDIQRFALLPVLDQLQIIYHLYRIFYHTEFMLDIQNVHSIQQMLDQLPQHICQDIATKATQRKSFHPLRMTYEQCCVLIEEYIKPIASEDPEVAASTFFALHKNDLKSKKALEDFSRLTAECQEVVLTRLNDYTLKQTYSYEKWRSYERLHPLRLPR
jgi:hypothetical protein